MLLALRCKEPPPISKEKEEMPDSGVWGYVLELPEVPPPIHILYVP